MKNKNNFKGFTIVELVIVIAIISILVAVMIPAVSSVIARANLSSDEQFASSLSRQLAIWSIENGKPMNESELRDAINFYYGTKDASGNYSDFYSKLKAKSSSQGYHYWYDVKSGAVILSTYSELAENGVSVISSYNNSFEPANPRCLGTGENVFFLLDAVGGELFDVLNNIKSVETNEGYKELIDKLDSLAVSDPLAAAIASKLKSTALANDNGTFIFEGNELVEHFYIADNTEVLKEFPADKNVTIYEMAVFLPESIKMLETGSLCGFHYNDSTNNWENSAVIYAPVEERELGSLVATNAFDCVLELPTGMRYAFINNTLTNLETGGTITTSYSSKLSSFKISANEGCEIQQDGNNLTILYPQDVGKLTLEAYDFIDENGNSRSDTVTWKSGEDTFTTNQLNFTILENSDNYEITVTAETISYTIVCEPMMPHFVIAENAKVKGENVLVVGGKNLVTLGTLFDFKGGNPEKVSNVSVKFSSSGPNYNNNNSSWKGCTISFEKSEDKEYTITISGEYNEKNVKDCTLKVKVKTSAYNVVDYESWKSAPSGNIALLNDITIKDTNTDNISSGGSNIPKVFKRGEHLYGNDHKITFGKFLIKANKDNCFITMGDNSSIENLTIIGPKYEIIEEDQSDSGYYVNGILADGGSIINSKITGFRVPLKIKSGTVTAKNSELSGGALATVHIANPNSKLVLKDPKPDNETIIYPSGT